MSYRDTEDHVTQGPPSPTAGQDASLDDIAEAMRTMTPGRLSALEGPPCGPVFTFGPGFTDGPYIPPSAKPIWSLPDASGRAVTAGGTALPQGGIIQTAEPRRPNGWAALARFGGIGDNLQCAVALPGLKAKFGHVEVITQVPQSAVFYNNPHIDKLTETRAGHIPNKSNEEWVGWFRGRAAEYDGFFHLSHSVESLLALFPGQTHFQWPASYRRRMCGKSYLENILEACELDAAGIGDALFYPTQDEKNQASHTFGTYAPGGKVIVWVISGTRLDKLHPLSSQIIARLCADVAPVMMLGAPGRDFELAKSIQQDVQGINGSDKNLLLGLSPDPANPSWPIRRVLTTAALADVVIGPDTGPMWTAAFRDNAKIMLLSHASPENITKHWRNTVTLHADQRKVPCWPCHQLHDTMATCTPNATKNGAACISSIDVHTVCTTAARLAGV